MLRTSGEERGAAPCDWEIPGVAPAVGGAGVGSRRRAGPTWAPGCASLALHSRGGSGPGRWLALYLPLNLAAMEGPQELLSGKLQLCFTPAARTSLLLLRLNDAALRALQECHQQQVGLARAPSSLSPACPEVGSQSATPAKEPGGGEQHPRALASPTLQVKPARQVPPPRAPDAGSWGRRFCCSWLKSVLCPQVRPVIAFQGNRGVSAGLGCVEVKCRENRHGLHEGIVRAGG